MSFNHHARTFQPNTGEDFMRSNFHYVNTARTSSPNNISFHGKSGTKRYLFAALALTLLLLIAAIVIIILFATGVFEKEAATLSPYVPTPAPNIDVYVNRTFECEMYILKQASSYYDEPNNSLTIQARRMANEAISSVMSRTALGSLGLRTELTDLQNSGDDLRLRFLMSIVVPSRSQIDANVVRNNVLTPRTIADLSLAMNGVAFDTNPNRILVTQV